ncbi:unnamed protein product [Paramecium primaurelia]|uniref:Tim44-like domain-containing protein n=1 Tax=Paramecium primaurelia TaxID=5886 RepID=A0A8S1MZV2_PARPR|nr:unnamed protein product [Paramecium primaurelia]
MKFLTLSLLYLIVQCQPNQHQSDSNDHVSDQHSYNDEYQFYPIEQNNPIDLEQLVYTILIFLGIFIIYRSRIFKSKNQTNINRNSNEFNLDELKQRLDSITQKLQKENMNLSYSFNQQWVEQKVKEVSVQQHFDRLNFHLKGSDCYGSWVQIGVIHISQNNQIETFSRKMYDDSSINGGDVLIYQGQFDDQVLSCKGYWYYLESKEKGEWLLKFI